LFAAKAAYLEISSWNANIRDADARVLARILQKSNNAQPSGKGKKRGRPSETDALGGRHPTDGKPTKTAQLAEAGNSDQRIKGLHSCDVLL
jgi:hypothetical protein